MPGFFAARNELVRKPGWFASQPRPVVAWEVGTPLHPRTVIGVVMAVRCDCGVHFRRVWKDLRPGVTGEAWV